MTKQTDTGAKMEVLDFLFGRLRGGKGGGHLGEGDRCSANFLVDEAAESRNSSGQGPKRILSFWERKALEEIS